LLLLNATWVPPIPIYLEQCLFALYLAAAIMGYWGVLSAALSLLARVAAPLGRRSGGWPAPVPPQSAGEWLPAVSRLRFLTIALTLSCVTLIPAKVASYALTDARLNATTFYEPWSNDPELIQFLTEHIGLADGQPFRGAINFLPEDLDKKLIPMATLWSRSVPTLNEYNHLVTPEQIYFVHALLDTDMLTRLNQFDMPLPSGPYLPVYWKALQMFGVRYAADRLPLPDEFNPGLPLITKPHHPHPTEGPVGSWYLYELSHPNVGNYSPTGMVMARSGAEIMTFLGQPDFDFEQQVVVSTPIPQPLVSAHDMRLSMIRGGLHVTGKSSSTSLVILPQQFSHCLRALDSRVRLLRVNLMTAGMIFSGEIDTDIRFDYGIFSPGCRRADLADMKQLDLKIDQRMPHLSGDRLFPGWDDAVVKLRSATDAFGIFW
jgi:hypothetical protein